MTAFGEIRLNYVLLKLFLSLLLYTCNVIWVWFTREESNNRYCNIRNSCHHTWTICKTSLMRLLLSCFNSVRDRTELIIFFTYYIIQVTHGKIPMNPHFHLSQLRAHYCWKRWTKSQINYIEHQKQMTFSLNVYIYSSIDGSEIGILHVNKLEQSSADFMSAYYDLLFPPALFLFSLSLSHITLLLLLLLLILLFWVDEMDGLEKVVFLVAFDWMGTFWKGALYFV